MDYREIVNAYNNQKLDTSGLKKDLELSKELKGRERFRTVYLSDKNIDFNTNAVNLQRTSEITDKVEEFYSKLENLLNDYYGIIIYLIKANKSWKFMKLSPQEYSNPKFNSLDIDGKFQMIEELNRNYSEYLKYQKIADIRDYIKYNGELNENEIYNLLFIQLMFNNIDNQEIKREFFCFDKKFLTSLVDYKKSKVKRLEDYMKSKRKEVANDYDKYSQFFNTEDYRDIMENLQLTSKTIHTSISYIIGAYYELSESEAEEMYINEEYYNITSLKEKHLKMSVMGKKLENKRKIQLIEQEKIEEKQKKLIELKMKQENLSKEKQRQDEKIEEYKKEEQIVKNTQVKEVSLKEQVNPLIFSWFEREDITLTRRVGSKNLVAFFEKIKQLEIETGIRVSLFLVTNTDKDITIKRLQEFQKKAKTNGLPNLIEGALGGYSSFRVNNSGDVTDISIMSDENRNKIIRLLEKPVRFYLPKEIIDQTEKNYIRYQFTSKRDQTITKNFLGTCISKILTDENIKKQPLQFLPYIEKDLAGIDVLLTSQLEGLKQLPEYYKSKYEIAPGKTLRVNIETFNDFIENNN